MSNARHRVPDQGSPMPDLDPEDIGRRIKIARAIRGKTDREAFADEYVAEARKRRLPDNVAGRSDLLYLEKPPPSGSRKKFEGLTPARREILEHLLELPAWWFTVPDIDVAIGVKAGPDVITAEVERAQALQLRGLRHLQTLTAQIAEATTDIQRGLAELESGAGTPGSKDA